MLIKCPQRKDEANILVLVEANISKYIRKVEANILDDITPQIYLWRNVIISDPH